MYANVVSLIPSKIKERIKDPTYIKILFLIPISSTPKMIENDARHKNSNLLKGIILLR